MDEKFRPITIFCDVNKTNALIFIPANEELHDNTHGFVNNPCSGCQQWSPEKITEVKEDLIEEWGEQSGVREGQINQLEQLLVDQARFVGGESQIIVAYCTPVGCR